MARAWAGRDGTRMQMAGTRRLGRRGDLEREYQIGTSGACVLWLAISPGACGRGCRWGKGLALAGRQGCWTRARWWWLEVKMRGGPSDPASEAIAPPPRHPSPLQSRLHGHPIPSRVSLCSGPLSPPAASSFHASSRTHAGNHCSSLHSSPSYASCAVASPALARPKNV